MGVVRGFTVGLIATVVVIGMVPMVSLARPGFNLSLWDTVLVYEADSNGDLTYDVLGTYSDLIDCSVDWTVVEDSTSSAPAGKNLVEFSMDYTTGKFGYLRMVDGQETKRISQCTLFSLESIDPAPTSAACPAPPPELQGTIFCKESTGDTDVLDQRAIAINDAFSDSDAGPFDVAFFDDDRGAEYWVGFSNHEGLVPFTGTLNLDGVTGLKNHKGHLVASVNNVVVIGGYLWTPGNTQSQSWGGPFTSGVGCDQAQCDFRAHAQAGPLKLLGIDDPGSSVGEYHMRIYAGV